MTVSVIKNFSSRYMPAAVKANANVLDAAVTAATALDGEVTVLQGKVGPSGSATIDSEATTKTVTHNFGSTAYVVSLVPQADLGSGRRYWVASKQANTFVITLDAAVSPAAARTFDWIVRGT